MDPFSTVTLLDDVFEIIFSSWNCANFCSCCSIFELVEISANFLLFE